MKPTHEPIEKVWFDEQPVNDGKKTVLRILAVGLVVGLMIICVGYKLDGTW